MVGFLARVPTQELLPPRAPPAETEPLQAGLSWIPESCSPETPLFRQRVKPRCRQCSSKSLAS
jgi:hypothetical protein